MRGWEWPWVTDQRVHTQRWTRNPRPSHTGRPLPHRQAPPGQAARSLALRPRRPQGTGQEEALLQATLYVNWGVGGRGKEEVSRQFSLEAGGVGPVWL